jgi:hypothetical protein
MMHQSTRNELQRYNVLLSMRRLLRELSEGLMRLIVSGLVRRCFRRYMGVDICIGELVVLGCP